MPKAPYCDGVACGGTWASTLRSTPKWSWTQVAESLSEHNHLSQRRNKKIQNQRIVILVERLLRRIFLKINWWRSYHLKRSYHWWRSYHC